MNQTKSFAIIAAVCRDNGIGKSNNLPWRLKKEMDFFTRITSGTSSPSKKNAVIMGRKTWESIPAKFKPLPNRINVLLSKLSIEKPKEAHHLFKSLEESVSFLYKSEEVDKIFIIGGAGVYKESMAMNDCQKIYLTRIDADFDCDTFFPEINDNLFKLIQDPDVPDEEQEENGIKYKYHVYQRIQ